MKRSKNKIVSAPARKQPAVDRESTTSPRSLRSRQSSARSPWKGGSNGTSGTPEAFLKTPESCHLDGGKTKDGQKHLDPVDVGVEDAAGQDAHPPEGERCPGRRVTFDRELTGQGFVRGADVDVGAAAELQLTRLEEMLERRMDAFDKKLDSVLLTVSSAASARQRHHKQLPVVDFGRRNSGWGESSVFGPALAPVYYLREPASLEHSRAHSKEEPAVGVVEGGPLPDLLPDEPAHSSNVSMFDGGLGSRSLGTARGMSRQFSPGDAANESAKLTPDGKWSRTPGRNEQRGRRESQGSDPSHRSAASSASVLSASGLDRRGDFAHKVWVFFEEPESSIFARCHHHAYMVLIFVSAVLDPIETLPNPPMSEMAYFKLSAVIESIFLLELLLKWYASPNKLGFATRLNNLIDFAIVPIIILRSVEYYVLSEHGTHHDPLADAISRKVLLCVVPVIRLIKALRGQRNFQLLTHTLLNVLEPLCVPFFMLMIVCMLFSCGIYVVEPRDNIVSVPEAMWLVILTVSTVGYGDIFPRTDTGRMVIGVLVFLGCLCMAMPIGIVGTAFTETWRNRERILAMKRIRDRLNQWGHDDESLRSMFKAYDKDHAGTLDVNEFIQCIRSLKLGFDEGQVRSLFMVLDTNGSGSLDMEEFVHVMGLKDRAMHFGVL